MSIYKDMYLALFHAQTKAIEDLKEAQLLTEKLFIEAEEDLVEISIVARSKSDQE
ncbi:hypothetical protein LJC27_07610 [Christensenellaceae bacterium OttesenSCG-928-M15]|nr:hypothetical protein [Christensenellaceae bacterium OttesenSCG-928-M15]